MKRELRKLLWLMGALVPMMALFNVVLGWYADWPLMYWAFPVVAYTLIPVFDFFIGTDESNPSPEEEERLKKNVLYDVGLYLYAPFLLAMVVFGAWLIGTQPLGLFEALGIAVTAGMSSGVGFINSHELVHRKNPFDRWLAKIVQAPTLYGHHFSVYHVRYHHKNVATPADPTSARLGESYWRYLPRAIFGGIRTAWQVERERHKDEGFVRRWLKNECVQAWALSDMLFLGMLLAFGLKVLPYLLFQAMYSIILLEAVNYIQHYGLLRAKRADGSYERCDPSHSWDSNHLMVTLYIYQLQRHADHHTNTGRPYQTLRCHPETPQLPASYVSMVFTALLPPLWFRIADPRVLKHYGGDLSLVNIDPRRRKRLQANGQQLAA